MYVRQARTHELPEVWQLAHDEYARRGFIKPQTGWVHQPYVHLDSIQETTVLVAKQCEKIIGTLTYTLDGPKGLVADVEYPLEVNVLRAAKTPLVCLWRFVTAERCRVDRSVARKLIKTAAQQLVDRGTPVLLAVSHPRHTKYYQRVLGFSAVAYRNSTDGLADAPSVLMFGGSGSYERFAE